MLQSALHNRPFWRCFSGVMIFALNIPGKAQAGLPVPMPDLQGCQMRKREAVFTAAFISPLTMLPVNLLVAMSPTIFSKMLCDHASLSNRTAHWLLPALSD